MATKKPVPVPVEQSLTEKHAEVLRTWRTMNDAVTTGSEELLSELLEAEAQGKGRHLFIQRIYGRFSRLRAARESKELKAMIKDV